MSIGQTHKRMKVECWEKKWGKIHCISLLLAFCLLQSGGVGFIYIASRGVEKQRLHDLSKNGGLKGTVQHAAWPFKSCKSKLTTRKKFLSVTLIMPEIEEEEADERKMHVGAGSPHKAIHIAVFSL
jgi:hypothetical protein